MLLKQMLLFVKLLYTLPFNKSWNDMQRTDCRCRHIAFFFINSNSQSYPCVQSFGSWFCLQVWKINIMVGLTLENCECFILYVLIFWKQSIHHMTAQSCFPYHCHTLWLDEPTLTWTKPTLIFLYCIIFL